MVERNLISATGNKDNTEWRVFFKKVPVFMLRVDDRKGIIPGAITVDEKNLRLYNWPYKGQIEADFANKPPLSIRLVNQDMRGTIYAVEFAGAEVFSLIGTNAGYARGGHYHPYDVNFCMPIGSGTLRIKQNGNWISVEQRSGIEVAVKINEIHYVIAETDMMLTEIPANAEIFRSTNDQASRKMVDDINNSKRLSVVTSLML